LGLFSAFLLFSHAWRWLYTTDIVYTLHSQHTALFPNCAEEPEPSEDKLVAYPVATSFLYYNEEPEASANKSANTLFYPAEEAEPSEDKLTTLFYQPVTTSFLYSAKRSNYNYLSNIIEELETFTDKVAMLTPTKSTPTKKHPSKKSEKTVSKAPRQSTSGRGRYSKK
jgi:hypothetical protein